MPNHTCHFCGRPFSGRRRLFCHECLPQHHTDPDYKSKYARLYQSAVLGIAFPATRIPPGHAAHLTPAARCRTCGQRPAERRGRNAGTLCEACFADLNERRAARRSARQAERARAQAEQARTSLSCHWCCGDYVATSRPMHRRFCSSDCSKAAAAHARRVGAVDRSHLPICLRCGERTQCPPALFGFPMCTQCRAADLENENRIKSLARRGVVSVGDDITVTELGQRDGWRCHICGKRVNPDVAWPNRTAGTIDHLVPIVAGGSHTWDNVALAHARCNSSRGEGGDVQLKLVG